MFKIIFFGEDDRQSALPSKVLVTDSLWQIGVVRVESEVFAKIGGFLFFVKRVRIWHKMAAKREQYGHNSGKFVKDMNNRKKKSN